MPKPIFPPVKYEYDASCYNLTSACRPMLESGLPSTGATIAGQGRSLPMGRGPGPSSFWHGVVHNLRRQRVGREGFSKCLHK